jgi:REJ domain
VTLIPSTSTFLVPLQFRRNQDFSISSNIELDCNVSLSTIIQWTINNCSLTCSSSFSFDQSVKTTLSELYVPARILPVGTYRLTLTVSMIVYSSLRSSASAYVLITSSGITANLVQLGTSMITSGYQQNLKLDPGTYSIDPDANRFNGSVSHTVIKSSIFNLVIIRIGLMHIIVEFMDCLIFQILMVP